MGLSFHGMGAELGRMARSAGDVAGALGGLFRNHRELLRLEAREEFGASIRLAILLGAGLFAVVMLCVALTALALRETDEGSRPTLLLVLALAYGGAALAGAAALFFRLRRYAALAAPLLQAAKEAEKRLFGEEQAGEAVPVSGSTPPRSSNGRRPETRTAGEWESTNEAVGERCGGEWESAGETVEGESCFWFDDKPR